MALYDYKYDWYDMFLPGSNLAGMIGTFKNAMNGNSSVATSGIGQIVNDISGTTATQQFNAQEAEKSRQFQKDMAQNQYQYAVNDIRKAGLNPALLYASGGNGNTAPSGASASSGSGSIGEVLGAVGQIMNGINSARALDARTHNQFDDKVTSYMYDNLGRIMEQVTYRNRR